MATAKSDSMAKRREGQNQRKRKNNQKFGATGGATGKARKVSVKELEWEEEARDLYSNYVNDHNTMWSIEECNTLIEAALLIRIMTKAETRIYRKACRDAGK